ARFKGGTAALASAGKPLVTHSRGGFAVTLHVTTGEPGTVHVRAMRAGRLAASLAFSSAPGLTAIGPFPVAQAGFYAIEVTLGAHSVHWGVCLGTCGARAPGGPFLLTRDEPTIVRAGSVWSVTINFHANHAAGSDLVVRRGSHVVKD